MFITLLCIIFSETLKFDGLTVIKLWEWFNLHPFLFMLALSEIIAEFISSSKRS